MAKSQKKRKNTRHNPLQSPQRAAGGAGLLDVSPESAQTAATLVAKLQSEETQDKVWACASISNIIHTNPSARQAFLSPKLISILTTLLANENHGLVSEAAGLLRNICVDGGHDASILLCTNELYTALKNAITQISKSLDHSANKQPQVSVDGMLANYAENIITIIWCLSETSDEAILELSGPEIIHLLMAILLWNDKLPTRTVAAAAQCLYLFSDTDGDIAKTIRNTSAYLFALINLATSSDTATSSDLYKVLIQILACGILRNISPLPTVVPLDLDNGILFPRLYPFLAISLLDLSKEVSSQLGQQGNPNDPAHSDYAEIQERLERTELQLSNLQLALEILAEACSSSQPSFDGEERKDVEMADIEADDRKLPSTTSPTLLALTEALIKLANPVPLSFSLNDAAPALARIGISLTNIHLRSLQCLGNLYLGLSTLEEEGTGATPADLNTLSAVWRSLWNLLAAIGYSEETGQERKIELCESAVGALWGVARLSLGRLEPLESDIVALCNLCSRTSNNETKAKCVGTLGCIAQYPSIPLNKTVSDFLFTFLAGDAMKAYPEAAVEAASAIIDIFSDEGKVYDSNFREGDYLRRLSGVVQSFRALVKSIDRRSPATKELRARGEEVLANLPAFIEYRKTVS